MPAFSDADRTAPEDLRRRRSYPAAWQIAMAFFIVIAVAMPLLSAAYVGGYERAAYHSRYDGCHGQDGYQALLRSSRSAQEGRGKGDAHQAYSKNEFVPGEPLNESLAVACQANAIMRASMHVQVMTYIGSLVPLGIGLLTALIGLWTFIADLKRRASDEIKTVGGSVQVVNGGITGSTAVQAGSRHAREAIRRKDRREPGKHVDGDGGTGSGWHNDLVDTICLGVVGIRLLTRIARPSARAQ